jgi:hypothetical protein
MKISGIKCGVGIYVASGSHGNVQRGKKDFERHRTKTMAGPGRFPPQTGRATD